MELPSIILVILVAVLYRCSVSLFPYSGYHKSPMHGDYEAQRHWMEITYNLPVEEWYHNTSRNDLQYWGLDYPPLTAYHSYIMGYVASKINSSWIELETSRGLETPEHKIFMRATAIASEIVFIPVALLYCKVAMPPERQLREAFTIMLYPGLVLIDHGHFQYNMVSLGLALLAIVCLCRHHDVLGSVAFCLALNHKQMELYHALPFFLYLLGRCLSVNALSRCILKFISLAVVVIGTFALCWYPFLWKREHFLQVLLRLFPFSRGLFEDKVANFWCSLSVLVKVKQIFDTETLTRYSFYATLIGLAPLSVDLLRKPTLKRFKLALVNSSLVFYLFSFQVHEKSILLAALPALLVLPDHPLASTWFLLISTFSLFPLLLRDGLTVPFLACQFIFFLITVDHPRYRHAHDRHPLLRQVFRIVFFLSVLAASALCLVHYRVPPPARYPDLYTVLNSLFCFTHFMGFLAYFHWAQYHHVDFDPKSPNPKAFRYGRGRTPKKDA